HVTASKDVLVAALGITNLNTYSLSVGGGLGAATTAIAVWSVGSRIEKNYTDDTGASANSLQNKDNAGNLTPGSDDESAQRAATGEGLISDMLASYGRAVFEGPQAVDVNADTIRVGNQGWQTGDAVRYQKGDPTNNSIGGLSDGQTYFVIADPATPTRIKL